MTASDRIDLRALWSNLTAPSTNSALSFSAIPLAGHPRIRLGRSAQGPAILFEVVEPAVQLAPIMLRNLAVHYNTLCRVESKGVAREEPFTVVMCTASDPKLQAIFFDALQPLLSRFEGASPYEVAAVVGALVELFRSINRTPSTSVLGMWGELFLISNSLDPDSLVSAWHVMPNDRYDFGRLNQRIEVKTTVGRRSHIFSLEQLQPPVGVQLMVASIITEVSAAGLTLQELINRISDRAQSPDTPARLLVSAVQALGSDLAAWGELRYDTARATESLALFDSRDIPRPTVTNPCISDVRFTVDLAGLPDSEMPLDGPLWSILNSPN